jgi:hypothetical protein
VSLIESAGCYLSGTEQCCYRTFDFINKTKYLAKVVSGGAVAEGCLAGH